MHPSLPPGWSIRPSERPRSLHPLISLQPLAASIRPAFHLDAPRVVIQNADVAPRPLRSRAALVGAILACVAIGAYVNARPAQPHPVTTNVVSGTAGVKTTSAGKHERRGDRPMTVTLDASLEGIDPNAKDAVKAAFGEWISNEGTLPGVTFDASTAFGQVAHDGKNIVLYGPITIPGHERDVATTVSYVDADTGEILEADTIYNAAYTFAVIADVPNADDEEPRCDGSYDLQNVATHEAGHSFGLGEDMDDAHATMYLRSSPCETHKRALTEADRAVMTSLYAESAPGSSSAAASSKGCGR